MTEREVLVSLKDVEALLDMADPTGRRYDPLLHALRQAVRRLPQLEGGEMVAERMRYLRRIQQWEGERAAMVHASELHHLYVENERKVLLMGHVPTIVLTNAGNGYRTKEDVEAVYGEGSTDDVAASQKWWEIGGG